MFVMQSTFCKHENKSFWENVFSIYLYLKSSDCNGAQIFSCSSHKQSIRQFEIAIKKKKVQARFFFSGAR